MPEALNKVIDQNDLTLLSGYLLGKSNDINYAADINKDGRINVFDSISIKRFINKTIK